MADRVILHCDMNSFFCSVELLEHPELANKPVAVAGSKDDRHGIILAKNQIAKSFGVATPEPIGEAKRKCPGLILLPPHHEKYQHYFHVINDIYLRYTDQVEPFSVDESWLDVTGSLKLFNKTGKELADEIRETVYKETGLTLSAGVSFNKVFAKMGSDYKKPYATTEITRENFKEILWPLPAGDLFFVGKSSAKQLYDMNIRTIGDIANSDPRILANVFGKHGQQMIDYANGIDDDEVACFGEERIAKSVGHGITFKRDIKGLEEISTAVNAISDKVASRLRRYNLKCQGVKVDIKDPNFISISRQIKLREASNLASDISGSAMLLIKDNWYLDNPIRLITVTGINTVPDTEESYMQLSIFDTEDSLKRSEADKKVEFVIDQIREKHGKSAISFGSLIDNQLGIDIDE